MTAQSPDPRPLLGPFARHEDALAMVPWATREARDVDPRAAWYAFGTCRLAVDAADPPRGVFNERSGLPAWSFVA